MVDVALREKRAHSGTRASKCRKIHCGCRIVSPTSVSDLVRFYSLSKNTICYNHQDYLLVEDFDDTSAFFSGLATFNIGFRRYLDS